MSAEWRASMVRGSCLSMSGAVRKEMACMTAFSRPEGMMIREEC
jgi:hypothetical protein